MFEPIMAGDPYLSIAFNHRTASACKNNVANRRPLFHHFFNIARPEEKPQTKGRRRRGGGDNDTRELMECHRQNCNHTRRFCSSSSLLSGSRATANACTSETAPDLLA